MTPTDPIPPKGSSRQGAIPPDHPSRQTDEMRKREALERMHAEHGHAAHDGLYNEDVAHEYSDVNVRGLLLFCVGLAGITGILMVAMWGLFRVFEGQAASNDPVVSPLAVPAGQLPPEPRLLTDEPLNLEQVREQEGQVLQGYGWVDEKSGVARIPIDEAKKRLLEQGLPVRPDAVEDPWIGTHAPARGESSGGRAIPLRPGATEEEPQQPAAPPSTESKPGGHGGH